MSIEALIFDLDGTLADTEEAHRMAFNLAFEHYGLGWHWSQAEYRRMLQTTGGKERIAAYIDRHVGAAAERERLYQVLPELHAEKTRLYTTIVNEGGLPLRPGIARLLDEAIDGGCRLALASSTTAVNVDTLLQAGFGTRGLDMFSVIVCGDQVRAKKPAPEIYKEVLWHLDLEPARVVAFEDSYNGLLSAKGAGIWTVVTPNAWTDGADFSSADLLLPHLGDPDHPLPGEPGHKLRQAPWLTLQELTRLAGQRG